MKNAERRAQSAQESEYEDRRYRASVHMIAWSSARSSFGKRQDVQRVFHNLA
jgi:hypothetical protein